MESNNKKRNIGIVMSVVYLDMPFPAAKCTGGCGEYPTTDSATDEKIISE